MVKAASVRYPRNRLLTASSIIVAIMFCGFILEKIFLPQSDRGWSITPLIDAVFFIGIGLSLSVAMAQYGYQAWSLDSHNFIEWYFCQQIGSTDWLRNWYNDFPEWQFRLQFRLLGPIGFLIGITMTGLGLVTIMAPLFAN